MLRPPGVISMTLIMLLQSILVGYKVSYSYLSIFTADQNRDACLETRAHCSHELWTLQSWLQEAKRYIWKCANSNKYGFIGGAQWACYCCCMQHAHSGSYNIDIPWQTCPPLHSQELLLALKSTLSLWAWPLKHGLKVCSFHIAGNVSQPLALKGVLQGVNTLPGYSLYWILSTWFSCLLGFSFYQQGGSSWAWFKVSVRFLLRNTFRIVE